MTISLWGIAWAHGPFIILIFVPYVMLLGWFSLLHKCSPCEYILGLYIHICFFFLVAAEVLRGCFCCRYVPSVSMLFVCVFACGGAHYLILPAFWL